MIFYGKNTLLSQHAEPLGGFLQFENTQWYTISNYNTLPPFFISLTSSDNFWFFISTTGGLTCGRTDYNNALFPYATVDKISNSAHTTGSYSALLVEIQAKNSEEKNCRLWFPFSQEVTQVYEIQRNIYKSIEGDKLIFEEKNLTLGLGFQVRWEMSSRYGFHRSCKLFNMGTSSHRIRLLDGLRNVLPAGVTANTQTSLSNLLNAYKRSELHPNARLAVFYLNAMLSDQPEAKESLLATTVWTYGFDNYTTLLSEDQLHKILNSAELETESDIRGQQCCLLIGTDIILESFATKQWGMVAEINQDQCKIAELASELTEDKVGLVQKLQIDIESSSMALNTIIAMNDGIQDTGSQESSAQHLANVMYNVMRGGYFIHGYKINRNQFISFLNSWNPELAVEYSQWLQQLPESMPFPNLLELVQKSRNNDLIRLCYEFLPLTFSRRHGDPSRPWNYFHIQTKDKAGNRIIAYQGNWRDIFQNWESLCFSYPLFYPSVIVKFLNACTLDGYNPYRISQDGFDWETPEPDNPWSNIGYWSDHQIIYLLRLMEQCEEFFPKSLHSFMSSDIFVYANIPYRIRRIEELLQDPRQSILFDAEENTRLESKAADHTLIRTTRGEIIHATMTEKLLVLLLAKLGNYLPGGGIWMNTQRPEWNDANNALVGWGLSMVTLAHLLRFVQFWSKLLETSKEIEADTRFPLHEDIANWFLQCHAIVHKYNSDIYNDRQQRLSMLIELGTAASRYRETIYSQGLNPNTTLIQRGELSQFLKICAQHFSETFNYSRQKHVLFESYQIFEIQNNEANIRKLYPMLEGQVAGLSLTELSARKSIQILDELRKSTLYRADQHSYMLYPYRKIKSFFEKNCIDQKTIQQIAGKRDAELLFAGIIKQDCKGIWHFDASISNITDLNACFEKFRYANNLCPEDLSALQALYESTFHHSEFTGRSGTFFAYEGLGSIYWHMVSKLLLAVQERLIDALIRYKNKGKNSETTRQDIDELKKRYKDIRNGLGFTKEVSQYGAFPCDPYSHTPWGQGAKQPGMTGQVKEGILMRYAELGLVVRSGKICFHSELILEDQWKEDGSIGFSFCGTAITLMQSEKDTIVLHLQDGSSEIVNASCIPQKQSLDIFSRNQKITKIQVFLAYKKQSHHNAIKMVTSEVP